MEFSDDVLASNENEWSSYLKDAGIVSVKAKRLVGENIGFVSPGAAKKMKLLSYITSSL